MCIYLTVHMCYELMLEVQIWQFPLSKRGQGGFLGQNKIKFLRHDLCPTDHFVFRTLRTPVGAKSHDLCFYNAVFRLLCILISHRNIRYAKLDFKFYVAVIENGYQDYQQTRDCNILGPSLPASGRSENLNQRSFIGLNTYYCANGTSSKSPEYSEAKFRVGEIIVETKSGNGTICSKYAGLSTIKSI